MASLLQVPQVTNVDIKYGSIVDDRADLNLQVDTWHHIELSQVGFHSISCMFLLQQ